MLIGGQIAAAQIFIGGALDAPELVMPSSSHTTTGGHHQGS